VGFLGKVIKVFLNLSVSQVEALLLLSQQEERYYLESKTIQGLEFQIKDLNEKISQVSHLLVADILGFIPAANFERFLDCCVLELVVTWRKTILSL